MITAITTDSYDDPLELVEQLRPELMDGKTPAYIVYSKNHECYFVSDKPMAASDIETAWLDAAEQEL